MGKFKRMKCKRAAERPIASGYGDFGASHERQSFQGFKARSLSAQSDINRNIKTLRSRSRALYMSAPLATSAIKNIRTSVVGIGLHLHAMPDFEQLGITKEEAIQWARKVEKEFALWADDKSAADVMGMHDFYELQQIAVTAWKMSGDVFCLFRHEKPTPTQPYGLRLQLIEADRVGTPGTSNVDTILSIGKTESGNKIFDGVELDKLTGKVIAYHIAKEYPGEYTPDPLKWVRVEKYGKQTGMPNIIHLYDAERPEQVRGVPFLAQVLESIMQHGRYLQAESVAALMETYLSGYITSAAAADSPILGGSGVGIAQEDEEEAEAVRDLGLLEPEPGVIHQLLPGEDIKFNDPKRPGTQFAPFLDAIAKQVGAAMETPADVLTKAYNSSYSASRAAIQDFWRTVIMMRDWFAYDFCGAIYTEWLHEAVARGRISAPGFFEDPAIRKAWLGHEWNGSAMPHLDPVKEANAMEIMVRNGWLTHKQATTRLNGGDWEANIAELADENEKIAEAQKKLNNWQQQMPQNGFNTQQEGNDNGNEDEQADA